MRSNAFVYYGIVATGVAGLSFIPAHAQTAINGGTPSLLNVNVLVRASVAPRCVFTAGREPSGSRNLGDLTQPFSADFPFSLSCNGPARVAVVSDNGGLRTPSVVAGYASLAAYDVQLTLVGDAGASATAACQSATLKSGTTGCSFRGPASISTGLLLPGGATDLPGSFIRVRTPATPPGVQLVGASNYTDRLTVTVSPAA